MFEAVGYIKHSEIDNFKNGCDPSTAQTSFNTYLQFSAESAPELIERMREYFGVDQEAITLDACDEIGRVDIQLHEDTEGMIASNWEIERWKEGLTILRLASYSFMVQEVTRQPVKLT